MLAVFAAGLTLFANLAPAFAQTPETTQPEDADVFDRGCGDDNGRDLCDQAVWAEAVARFGLEPAESVQSAGLRGIRVFTIDGHANDMPVVSVLGASFDEWGYPEKGKDGQPKEVELEIRWRPVRDEYNTAPARLTRKAWFDLYLEVMDFQEIVATSPERKPEKPAAQPNADGSVVVSVCRHPWVTVTESLTDDGVTRRIRRSCDSDAVLHASFDMSDKALRGFPHCNHLDPANLGDASEQLRRCLQLEGSDRFAAAEVANLIDASRNGVTDLQAFLEPDVRLVRANRSPVVGATAVGAALADLAYEDYYLLTAHLVGEPDRVVARDWLQRYTEDGMETADIKSSWRRRGETWRIAEIVIGPSKIEK
jgi:hypothetical protein